MLCIIDVMLKTEHSGVPFDPYAISGSGQYLSILNIQPQNAFG